MSIVKLVVVCFLAWFSLGCALAPANQAVGTMKDVLDIWDRLRWNRLDNRDWVIIKSNNDFSVTTPRRRDKKEPIKFVHFFEKEVGREGTWAFKWSKKSKALKMELVEPRESADMEAWRKRALRSFDWSGLTPKQLQQELEAHYEKHEIRQAQERLKEAGLYPGKIDGIPGPMTQKALRQYQRAEGLRVTGRLDDPTRKSLSLHRS